MKSDRETIKHLAQIDSIEHIPQPSTVTPFGWLVIHITVGTIAIAAIGGLILIGAIR